MLSLTDLPDDIDALKALLLASERLVCKLVQLSRSVAYLPQLDFDELGFLESDSHQS